VIRALVMHGDANFYELLPYEARLVPRLAWTLPFRSPVSGTASEHVATAHRRLWSSRSRIRSRDGGRSTRYDRICRTWDVCWS